MARSRFHRLPIAPPIEWAVGTDENLNLEVLDWNRDPVPAAGHNVEWRLYPHVLRRWPQPFEKPHILAKTSLDGEITVTDGLAVVALTQNDVTRYFGRFWYDLRYTDENAWTVSYLSGLLLLRANAN